MNDIDEFISKEYAYFAPILKRLNECTLDERENWRKETIRERQERISMEVFDLLKGRVKYGPLKGLKLNKNTWWGKLDLGSQCLGLYEKEILNQIELIEPDKYPTFVDIGAADGYYAVGMLTSRRAMKTVCFEQAPEGRKAILSNWEANGKIGELIIHGEANTQSLLAMGPDIFNNALVLIDIEGGEFEFLSFENLRILSNCLIFIEIHNWVDGFEGKYTALLKRAAVFFDIDVIHPVDRSTVQFKELRDFTDDNRLLLVSERRPCLMRFLKLTPRGR